MLLEDKRLVITGVLNDSSIAYSVARLAQEQGAEIVLTSFGRAKRITERVAKRLPQPPEVIELDVTSEMDLAALTDDLRRRWGRVDGALHSGVPFIEQMFAGMLDQGIDVPPERAAHLVVFLASGRADALSGRYLDANDDVQLVLERGDEIREADLYVLRSRR